MTDSVPTAVDGSQIGCTLMGLSCPPRFNYQTALLWSTSDNPIKTRTTLWAVARPQAMAAASNTAAAGSDAKSGGGVASQSATASTAADSKSKHNVTATAAVSETGALIARCDDMDDSKHPPKYGFVGTVVIDPKGTSGGCYWHQMTTRGMNEAGFAFTFASLGNRVTDEALNAKRDHRWFGRKLLRCAATVDEAIAIVKAVTREERGFWGNYVFADAEGRVAAIEVLDFECRIVARTPAAASNQSAAVDTKSAAIAVCLTNEPLSGGHESYEPRAHEYVLLLTFVASSGPGMTLTERANATKLLVDSALA